MATKKQDVIVEEGAVYVLRAGTPLYVKTADICGMTGESNQWVGQLVSQGTLHKVGTPHGAMFEVSAAMRSYCEALKARAQKKQPSTVEQEKQLAEASIKKSKAIISELEAAELQGKMHRSEDVAAMTEDLVYSIRGMLVALPGRLAVDTAQAQTAAETADLIRKEVFEVMAEASGYRYDPEKYAERVRERRKWEAVHDDGGHDESGE